MDENACLNTENFNELLNTILISSTINRKTYEEKDEINKTILKDQEIQKSLNNNDSENVSELLLPYIIPEDYSQDDFFQIQAKYDNIVYKFSTNEETVNIHNQLKHISQDLDQIKNGVSSNINSYNISPSSSIENLVEKTYSFDPRLKFQMAEEISYIKFLFNKWRPIGGDGNCFYRSVIFNYLENLIFDKNILCLQRLVIELVEKFDCSYSNTKNLRNEIKDPLLKINLRLIVTIFKIIIDILDKPGTNSINEALAILTKSFNFSKIFDMAMILYLRFILYEFILKNKDHYFSKDFPIKLGNLLPFQYETEDGKFLYDKFFNEDLLKLYTYAEKIAIYITPFVIKMNLRVLFYDYGEDCNIQTKDFSCFLKNKQTLNILYRKAHYDIIYSKSYEENYSDYIDHYKSLIDRLCVVDEDLISFYMQNEVKNVDTTQSKIFDKKNNKNKNSERTDLNYKLNQDQNESSQSTQISKNCDSDSVDEDYQTLKLLEKEQEGLVIELKKIIKKKNITTNDKFASFEIRCGCKFNDKKSLSGFIKDNFSDLKLNQDQSKIIIIIFLKIL